MSKYYRNQPVISRNADEFIGEDHWLREFQKKLQKGAVQTREQVSLFDQINSIMNSNSKYPSVEAAVKDMQERSGLIAYINKMNKVSNKKVAADESSIPEILKNHNEVIQVLENVIESAGGYETVPAIVSKMKATFSEIDPSYWDDEEVIKFIFNKNQKAKEDKHSIDFNYSQLGRRDNSTSDQIDPENTDAFHALTPVKS
jgi:hypothetical protein